MTIPIIMIGLQLAIWIFVIVALVHIVIKRIDDKSKEDFEKREN